jgi:hypothetical protein
MQKRKHKKRSLLTLDKSFLCTKYTIHSQNVNPPGRVAGDVSSILPLGVGAKTAALNQGEPGGVARGGEPPCGAAEEGAGKINPGERREARWLRMAEWVRSGHGIPMRVHRPHAVPASHADASCPAAAAATHIQVRERERERERERRGARCEEKMSQP